MKHVVIAAALTSAVTSSIIYWLQFNTVVCGDAPSQTSVVQVVSNSEHVGGPCLASTLRYH
jgi:hypothetical protein